MLSPKSKKGPDPKPYLRNANVQWGRFELRDVATMDFDAREKEKFLLEPGDLLVCEGGEPGRCAIWDGSISPCYYQKALHRIRSRENALDTEFLMYRLWYASSIGEFSESERRSTIAHLPLERLQAIQVRLPALAEQRRVAAELRQAFALVDHARDALAGQIGAAALLEDRVLVDAFNGMSPIRARTGDRTALDGWAWRELTGVARLESGHTPSRRHPEWWGGDVPWIALPDIRALDGTLAHRTNECTNELGIANSSARVLPAHTVVMSRTASVGFVTMLGRPMATSQDFVNWVCGRELDPFFLAHALRASRPDIRRLASGSVHKTIYMPTLHSLQVCMPPVEEQQRIVRELDARLAEADRLYAALAARQEQIDQLPSAILRTAFTPRVVRVADALASRLQHVTPQKTSTRGIYFRRGAVASYFVHRLHERPTFGRVMFQKLMYLAEAHIGVELQGTYARKAAGPLAVVELPRLESLAAKQGWFTKEMRPGGKGYHYLPGPQMEPRIAAAIQTFGDRRERVDRLIDVFGNQPTEVIEIVATLFAAWNDFLIDGRQPTDDEIIDEVRVHWHPAKARFTEERLSRALAWMRNEGLVPCGRGPRTELLNA